MSNWSKEEAEKAILEVKKKAMQDADFRKLCLTDAAAAMKAISGKELPGEVKLKFIENDGEHITIVLPDMAESEMPEEELDMIVGGTMITAWCGPWTSWC